MVVVGVKSKWGESIFLGSLVKKGLQKENSISESSGGAAGGGGGGGGRGTIFVVTKKGCVVGDFWSFVCLFFFSVPSFFSTIPIKYIRKLRSRLSPGFNG